MCGVSRGYRGRFNASDKRVFGGGKADVNQLLPLKYVWAWDLYEKGLANHWVPGEIKMGEDAALWNSLDGLTDDERRVVMRNLGFFATAETTISNNVTIALFRHVAAAELRQYLLRQAFEEAVHTHMFKHIVTSLGLDDGEVFNMYHEVPSVEAKDRFIAGYTDQVLDPSFTVDPNDTGSIRVFLKNLIAQYICMEGLLFYTGFAMNLSFVRRNILRNLGKQYQYTMRDEAVHVEFGAGLIHEIRREHPEAWDADLAEEAGEMIHTAIGLEVAYCRDVMPNGIAGINAELCERYVRHIGDRRRRMLGLSTRYGDQNPFPWLSEVSDLSKETNFFENQVLEYQTAGTLSWD